MTKYKRRKKLIDPRLQLWMTGVFLGLNTELKSLMGWQMLLPMFAAAILGGVGRIEGEEVAKCGQRVGKQH